MITIGRIAGMTADVPMGAAVTAHVCCGCWQRQYGAWFGRIVGRDGVWVLVRQVKGGEVVRVSAACLSAVDEHHLTRE